MKKLKLKPTKRTTLLVSILAVVSLSFLTLNHCGPGINSIMDPGSIEVLNLRNGGTVQTGFLIGTSNGVSLVAVQYDGGTTRVATGNSTWSVALPNGTSTWKIGSTHTIAVGSVNGSQFTALKTISVIKGQNHDINGDGYTDIVVGAPTYNNGTVNDGGLYISYGSTTGISTATAGNPTILGKASTGGRFGYAVYLGDLNGDGYADLVAGSPTYANGGANAGGIYIFPGSSSGISSTTADTPTVLGQSASAGRLGVSLALGDLNNDGYDDLVAGAFSYTNVTPNAGGVYILNGSSTGISTTTAGAPTILGQASSAGQLGTSIALGDLNADGFLDLVAGAPNYTNATANAGGVYIYSGSSTGIASSTAGAPTLLGQASSGSLFGFSLAIGDLNNNRKSDLAVGAYSYTNGTADAGGVYIFNGSSSGIASTTVSTPTLLGQAASAGQFGYSVAIGDLNNDGIADLVAGAPGYTNGSSYAGGVYVYSGSASGISAATVGTPTILGKASSVSNTGFAVGLSDQNGDWIVDLLIGAPTYTNGTANAGGVYVYNGSSSGITSSTATSPTLLGKASSGGQLGFSLF